MRAYPFYSIQTQWFDMVNLFRRCNLPVRQDMEAVRDRYITINQMCEHAEKPHVNKKKNPRGESP